MESGLLIGRVWGIPIRLHLSWFAIFFLVAWSLAMGYFPQEYASLRGTPAVVLGIVTSILFGLSVLLHELGHAWVAQRTQVPVRGITLFLFGGVAQVEKEPRKAGHEFWIAIAGPLVSVGLAGLFGLTWILARDVPVLAAPGVWLARINLALGLFNLIPGFPLDGGRVLRAVVWKITGSYRRATRIASTTGQVVAFGFIGFGIFTIFRGDLFNGAWLAFIGWFLQNAAASVNSHLTMREMLSGVRVSQVMDTSVPSVPGSMLLERLVNDRVASSGEDAFLVHTDLDGRPDGLVTLRDVQKVPRQMWESVTIKQIMEPISDLVAVYPDMELVAALERMDDAKVAHIPVIDGAGLIRGLLSRQHVLHYMRTRAQIGV